MYSSGDTAKQVVRMSLEGAEFALKTTDSTAENLAAALYTVLKDQKKTKGKAHIETTLQEERPTTIYTVKKEDAPEFTRQAKKCGILYAPIPVEKDDNTIDILVFEDDAARASRIMERFNFTVVDTAPIEEDIQKPREQHGSEPATSEQAAPEKSQDDELLDELMEEPAQEEKAEPEHPAAEKTDSFTPAAEKSHPSAPISENSSKSARGTFDGPEKSSVHQELRGIWAQWKRETEMTKAEEPSVSKKPAQKTTRHQPPKPKKKPKSKERQMLMNNFDDLSEQQPQKETALRRPEGQKERPRRQWWQIHGEKQRKKAYAPLDKIFGAFAEGNGNIKACPDVQSRFPFHSIHSTPLIGAQCPQTQCVGGYKEQTVQGIGILEEEKKLPVIVLEPGKAYRRDDGSTGQNFYAREVYDISQTLTQGQYQPQVTYDNRLPLKGLIANFPMQVRMVDELPQGRGAVFSGEQNAILVKKGMGAPDVFRCISLETANIQPIRNSEGYSREADGYKAYAISYMLCRRYDIEAKDYDIGRLNSVLKGQSPREGVPAAFSDIRETFKSLNGHMARAVGLTRDTKQKELERQRRFES